MISLKRESRHEQIADDTERCKPTRTNTAQISYPSNAAACTLLPVVHNAKHAIAFDDAVSKQVVTMHHARMTTAIYAKRIPWNTFGTNHALELSSGDLSATVNGECREPVQS